MTGYLDSKVSETKILTDDMKVSYHYYISDVQLHYTKQVYTVYMNFHSYSLPYRSYGTASF